MLPVRSLASKRHTYIVLVILLLGEIMLICSCYLEKKLVYIIIITSFNHQPSFYIKCTKLNIRLSYNIKLVFNTKYTFILPSNVYSLSNLLSRNT